MKIILLVNDKKLGKRNLIVEVADSYAKNVLIPKKIAVEADKTNLNLLSARLEKEKRLHAESRANAQNILKRLDEFECLTIKANTSKDGKIRTATKTTKYEKGAILVPSKTVFCGGHFKMFDIRYKDINWTSGSYFYHDRDYLVNIYTKPRKTYLYLPFPTESWSGEKLAFDRCVAEFNKQTISGYQLKNKKTASVLSEESIEVHSDILWENTKKAYDKDSQYSYVFRKRDLARYQGVSEEEVQSPTVYDILNLQYSECNITRIDYLKAYFDKYKVPYAIDADEEQLEREGY